MTSSVRKNKDPKKLAERRTRSYDPIDVAVGQRLKIRRIAFGMSQERLAEHLGVTFQQVQKYEKGANRLAASTLHRASRALSVPVDYFFEDVDKIDVETEIIDLNAAAYQQATAFMKIEDVKARTAISALVKALAASDHEP